MPKLNALKIRLQLWSSSQRRQPSSGMVNITLDGDVAMRAYVKAVAIIAGLLSTYLALLPLTV